MILIFSPHCGEWGANERPRRSKYAFAAWRRMFGGIIKRFGCPTACDIEIRGAND